MRTIKPIWLFAVIVLGVIFLGSQLAAAAQPLVYGKIRIKEKLDDGTFGNKYMESDIGGEAPVNPCYDDPANDTDGDPTNGPCLDMSRATEIRVFKNIPYSDPAPGESISKEDIFFSDGQRVVDTTTGVAWNTWVWIGWTWWWFAP